MLKDTSTLKFFSRDQELSQKFEAQLKELRKQLKATNNETPETELKALQKKTDQTSAKAKELRTIKLKVMSIAQFKRLPHIKIDENEMTHLQVFEQRKATILLASELMEEQFSVLKAPDFHQLYSDVCEYILTPADKALGTLLDENVFAFDLLHPFKNELDEMHGHVRFNVPNTGHSESLAEIVESDAREDFMFRVVTGLEQGDFEFLSTNDYLALKPQVGAFF